MEIIDCTHRYCQLTLTKSEIEIIINVLKEVLRQIEPWEYKPRIGLHSTEGTILKNELTGLLEHLSKTQGDKRKITKKVIEDVFEKLINNTMSRESCSNYAYKLMQAYDDDQLEFLPRSDEYKISRGISYLLGVDLKDNDEGYFHSTENFIDYLNFIKMTISPILTILYKHTVPNKLETSILEVRL